MLTSHNVSPFSFSVIIWFFEDTGSNITLENIIWQASVIPNGINVKEGEYHFTLENANRPDNIRVIVFSKVQQLFQLRDSYGILRFI